MLAARNFDLHGPQKQPIKHDMQLSTVIFMRAFLFPFRKTIILKCYSRIFMRTHENSKLLLQINKFSVLPISSFPLQGTSLKKCLNLLTPKDICLTFKNCTFRSLLGLIWIYPQAEYEKLPAGVQAVIVNVVVFVYVVLVDVVVLVYQ